MQIEFSKDEKDLLTGEIQRYMAETFDQEIGRFDALDLLDFISEKFGACYYNRGLLDAQAILSKRMDGIVEAISELEKPNPLERYLR